MTTTITRSRLKPFTTVGTTNADYNVLGKVPDAVLNSAISALHTAGGGRILVTSPLTLTNIITMYPDVSLDFLGDQSIISISATFASGVVFREQSGAANGMTITNLTLDLAGKANVGGIHIYQGNYVTLKNVTIKNQGYSNASKWTVRVGNYTSGSPDGTASHGTVLEGLRILNCNSGTYEQILFVNQQDARIDKAYFEGNTNSLAYELMLYINNKNVVVNSPHFENPSAHSIGMMESDGIQVKNVTATFTNDFKIGTIINTRNVIIDGVVAKNSKTTPTAAAFEFFDRAVGPDGFTQIVEDTENVTIKNVKLDGWKSTTNLQLVSVDYTMNHTNIEHKDITIRNQSVPFNIGGDNVGNNLTNWDFDNVNILSWSGASTGAWQLRGYASGVGQLNAFRFRRCKVATSTGGGSSAAIRNISGTVEVVRDCDFSATFSGYGALSAVTSGVFQDVVNTKGVNPKTIYAQGNVTGATTFDRTNGDYITATQTANITVTMTSGKNRGDELTLDITTGGFTQSWPANLKLGGALAMTGRSTVHARWDGTNWIEVGRAVAVA